MSENNLIKDIAKHELTRGQTRIADYIVKNQKRVLGMTALEIGREIGVSDASVIRFCRAIGYEGFNDLKAQIDQELKENRERIGKHSLFDRFVIQEAKYGKDEEKENENEAIQLMTINLETSLRQNSRESYERAADTIRKAKHKMVIGLRGGRGCALQFSRLLSHLTTGVDSITDEGHDQICKLTDLGENDIAVFLNFPRYYKIDEKIGVILAQKRIPCILITDSMASPVAKYAEEVLLVETEHCGFFHSMLGVTGVLEYLLILMCQKESDTFRERLKERDAILDGYLLS